MSSITIRVTSSSTNAAGTGPGQQPDQGAPSYWDVRILASTDTNLPIGVYDGYCLNPNVGITVGPAHYSATEAVGDATASFAPIGLSSITQTQVDEINWVLSQNFTSDPKFAGQYNYGEVQTAIWKIAGYTDAQIAQSAPLFLSDNGRNVVSSDDANQIYSEAQAAVASGHGVVPTNAYFSEVINAGGTVQPLIIQLQSGKIGDFVWQDTNGNGVQDAGEAGVNGVTVELLNASGAVIATTVTGDDYSTSSVEQGYYQFTGLQAGNYQVKFIAPAGEVLAMQHAAAATTTTDSDANATTGVSDMIALAAGQTNQSIDAGLVPTSSVSGTVYLDNNHNGALDTGDTRMAGVTVTLFQADGITPAVDASGHAVAPVVTDANGNYNFGNLLAGNYVVQETQPNGYGYATAASQGGIGMPAGLGDTIHTTLSVGQSGAGNNFGVTTGSLSGTVQVDTTHTALAGVTVTLYQADGVTPAVDANGVAIAPVQTDVNGNYSFANLVAGNYVVQETQPAGYGVGSDTLGTQGGSLVSATVIDASLAPGQSGTGNNFGVTTGSLSGTVYVDHNNNGVLDGGDTALANVTVTLYQADGVTAAVDANGVAIAPVQTDANGNYSFANLVAGNYVVQETQPAGYGNAVLGGGTVLLTNNANETIQTTLVAGQNGTDNNFGVTTGSLSGTVQVDNTSTALAGVTVSLYQADGVTPAVDANGVAIAPAVTDANGNYSFGNLVAGNYVVQETQPAGYGMGSDSVGTQGGSLASSTVIDATLGAGVNGSGNNFGVTTGSLSGTVQVDTTHTALAGVTVSLYQADGVTPAVDANGVAIAPAVTDGNGNYSFGNLVAGNYVVQETQPAGYGEGTDTLGTQGGSLPAIDVINATLAAGQNGSGNNFVETTGSLSGNVSVQGSDLAGVTVTLYQADGVTPALDANGNVLAPVQTDIHGNYSFTNLVAGNYVVQETQPAGYGAGSDTLGTQGGSLVSPTVIDATLAAGQNGTGNNFNETTGSLAGTVYVDNNSNGVLDGGDTTLAGVTVTLYQADGVHLALDANGNAITAVQTDANGDYSFANLVAGNYVVKESQPAGYGEGTDAVGSQGGSLGVQDVINASLAAGQNGSGNNFGETTGSLSGNVSVQGNPLANVALTLEDMQGHVLATTTTAADGSYGFAGLLGGNYQIVETQPAGYGAGGDSVGTQGGSLASSTVIDATLAAGANGTGNNFAETTGSLSGSVYYDKDSSGSLSTGDVKLAGVTMTLYQADGVTPAVDANGVAIAPVQTDANGNYSFANLLAGNYVVVETQPSAYLEGKDTLGSQGGSLGAQDVINATLAAGQNGTGNNFGETLAPVTAVGSISGTVYSDTGCSKGAFDSGDKVLAGSVVTLYQADGVTPVAGVASITVGASGTYSFSHLALGNYVVKEVNPAGYSDVTDSDGNANGASSIAVALTTAKPNSTGDNFLDAQAVQGSISGTVYSDTGCSKGAFDSGDKVLAGSVVTLYQADGVTPVAGVASITVGASGTYSFANLALGNYVVKEVNPTGYIDVTDSDGNTNGASSIAVALTTAKPNSTGDNFLDALPVQGSISGTVYSDTGCSKGAFDSGDKVLAGSVVTLFQADGVTPVAGVASITVGASGTYSFTNLALGNYVVKEVNPAGYSDVTDSDGNTNGASSIAVALTSAHPNSTGDNFLDTQAVGSISGNVYVDANNNGKMDSGEVGIGGDKITLTGSDNQGHAVSLTTTTACNGSYSFGNLLAGTYTVSEAQPAGYADGKDSAGSVGGTVGQDVISQIVLGAGAAATGYNFGEQKAASISGNVYLDANNNGKMDSGEVGISGDKITLTGSDNQGHAVSLTTTTGCNGSYSFGNLLAGTYTVSEAQPTGYADGKDAVGSVGGTLGQDVISQIVLTTGTAATGYNFGEQKGASISGCTYVDSKHAGSWQSGDTAVCGEKVTLTGTDCQGHNVNLSTTTGADGSYCFNNLLSGSYTVTETHPTGCNGGQSWTGNQGGTCGSSGSGSTASECVSHITLGTGTAAAGYNFCDHLSSGNSLPSMAHLLSNNSSLDSLFSCSGGTATLNIPTCPTLVDCSTLDSLKQMANLYDQAHACA